MSDSLFLGNLCLQDAQLIPVLFHLSALDFVLTRPTITETWMSWTGDDVTNLIC